MSDKFEIPVGDPQENTDGKTYMVVRTYFDGHPAKVLARGKTLEQVQHWCSDPDTSSSTTTSEAGKKHTEDFGAWFDGYDEEG